MPFAFASKQSFQTITTNEQQVLTAEVSFSISNLLQGNNGLSNCFTIDGLVQVTSSTVTDLYYKAATVYLTPSL